MIIAHTLLALGLGWEVTSSRNGPHGATMAQKAEAFDSWPTEAVGIRTPLSSQVVCRDWLEPGRREFER